jgi:hypothetical protein
MEMLMFRGVIEHVRSEDGTGDEYKAYIKLVDDNGDDSIEMHSNWHSTIYSAVEELTDTLNVLDVDGLIYWEVSDWTEECMNPEVDELGEWEDILNENNDTINIDVTGMENDMYRVEAELMLPSNVYLSLYTMNPASGKDKLEDAIRSLGYTGDFLHV